MADVHSPLSELFPSFAIGSRVLFWDLTPSMLYSVSQLLFVAD